MLASITNDPKRQKSEMICKNLKTTNKSEMGITNPTPILEILFANYQNNWISRSHFREFVNSSNFSNLPQSYDSP